MDAPEGVAVAGVFQRDHQAAVTRFHGLEVHAQQGEVGGFIQQAHEGLGVSGVDGLHGTHLFRVSCRYGIKKRNG